MFSFFRSLGLRCFAVVLMVLVSGCVMLGPDYNSPVLEVPDSWTNEVMRDFNSDKPDMLKWWSVFNDPVLNKLIEETFDGNLDLKMAASRIAQSRALMRVAKGDLFPTISGLGQASETRASSDINPSLPPTRDRTEEFYEAGASVSWELDVWGRIRRSGEAAEASLEASEESYRDTMVLLYAETADNYMELRALQARLAYALANAEAQREMAELVRDRKGAGLAADLDVNQADLAFYSTEAGIPLLQSGIAETINRIAVLTGRNPGELNALLSKGKDVPNPPDNVGVGLPVDLLRQRPDIRNAERSLAAQNARIGSTKAELYPTFSLPGTFLLQAYDNGSDVFEQDNLYYSFGPSVSWNLFTGGKLRNNLRYEEERTREALFNYNNTVLTALEEVENAMVAFVREKERVLSLQKATQSAVEAVLRVKDLYINGLTNFNNVLDMVRILTQQQDQLADSQGNVNQELIDLYKALGGGWDPFAY